MKKMYTLCIAILITAITHGQSFVDRVLVLNEGYFDYITNEILIPVSLGSYDPITDTYETIHTIDGVRFASDIVVDDAHYFIAADNKLLKYDRYADALMQEVEIEGIRKIAVDANYIVITRGEYLESFDSYIVVLHRNDLSPAFEISADELQYTTEGVEIIEGKAYVAVNNGFVFGEEVGKIAVVDLTTQTLEATIDLGPDGINPDNLMWDGEFLYTFNNKDFSGSSVSVIKATTADVSTTNLLNVTSGCGTSAYFNGEIYYQDFLSTHVSIFDPVTEETIAETDYTKSFYGLAFDNINERMYASETDFYAYGKVFVYDFDGNMIASFETSVSPGNIVLDMRSSTAIESIAQTEVTISPNPVIENVNLSSSSAIHKVEIFDTAGKLYQTQTLQGELNHTMNISTLPAGLYVLHLQTSDRIVTEIISKL